MVAWPKKMLSSPFKTLPQQHSSNLLSKIQFCLPAVQIYIFFSTQILQCRTEEIYINSLDQAYELYYAAHKYMMPKLKEKCSKFLGASLTPDNVWSVIEFVNFFDCNFFDSASSIGFPIDSKDLSKLFYTIISNLYFPERYVSKHIMQAQIKFKKKYINNRIFSRNLFRSCF